MRRRASFAGVAVLAATLAAGLVIGLPVAATAAKVSPPAITKVDPPSGPLAGGISVTITGAAFTGTSAVKFGSTDAVSFSVSNHTTLIAVSPAEPAGTVDVRVTANGQTSGITPADRFTYQDVPTVASIFPISGPLGGGTSVTITGANFVGATAVKFGTVAVSSDQFTVEDANHITAVSPAITQAGGVDVRVTTSSGTSATGAGDVFTYQDAPAITKLVPPSGPLAGGTAVTINGVNFLGASEVDFGTTVIPPASFTVDSKGQNITLTTPAGSGKVDVKVITPSGTSAPSSFSYQLAPKIASVSPKSGTTKGGTRVTVKGQNFTGTQKVEFGTTDGTNLVVASGTELTIVSPAESKGTVDIRVTTPSGTSPKVTADHFTFQGVPTVTGVSPSSGALGGGTTVTITGTNFTGTTAVKFGAAAAASFTVNSSTKITAKSPAANAGTIHVRVTTSVGTSALSSANDFTFTNSTSTPSGGVGTGAGGTAKGFPLAPVAAIAVALAGMAGLFVLRRRARPRIG